MGTLSPMTSMPLPSSRIDDRSERRRYLLISGLLLVVHALIAAAVIVSGDEAYYWDASRHAELSYFDQPGLVIWLVAAGRMLFGNIPLAVRLPALLSTIGFALVLPHLVRRLGGTLRQAGSIMLLAHAMPIVFLGLSYTSTDVAMAIAYLAVVLGSMVIADGDRRGWWLVGVASGLGFLAKFPVVVALATVPVALLSPPARRDLRTPTPWMAAGLSIALTLPVWLWELQYDFAGIRFQLLGRQEESGWHLRFLLEFLGGSLLLASPLLVVVLVRAVIRGRPRDGGMAWRIAITGALAPFVFFGLISLRSQVAPHWGGPGLILLTVMGGLCAAPSSRWLRVASGLGVCISLTVLSVALYPTWLPQLGIATADSDSPSPLIRVVEQRALTAELERQVDEWHRQLEGKAQPLVASDSYSWTHTVGLLSDGRLNSRLAFLSGGPGSHGLASLYWYSPDELRGRDVLVFSQKSRLGEKLEPLCESVAPLPAYRWDGGVLGTLEISMWRCANLLKPEGVFTRL